VIVETAPSGRYRVTRIAPGVIDDNKGLFGVSGSQNSRPAIPSSGTCVEPEPDKTESSLMEMAPTVVVICKHSVEVSRGNEEVAMGHFFPPIKIRRVAKTEAATLSPAYFLGNRRALYSEEGVVD
jgi:hypothetical protein